MMSHTDEAQAEKQARAWHFCGMLCEVFERATKLPKSQQFAAVVT
jgi:hypothetical protein